MRFEGNQIHLDIFISCAMTGLNFYQVVSTNQLQFGKYTSRLFQKTSEEKAYFVFKIGLQSLQLDWPHCCHMFYNISMPQHADDQLRDLPFFKYWGTGLEKKEIIHDVCHEASDPPPPHLGGEAR